MSQVKNYNHNKKYIMILLEEKAKNSNQKKIQLVLNKFKFKSPNKSNPTLQTQFRLQFQLNSCRNIRQTMIIRFN